MAAALGYVAGLLAKAEIREAVSKDEWVAIVTVLDHEGQHPIEAGSRGRDGVATLDYSRDFRRDIVGCGSRAAKSHQRGTRFMARAQACVLAGSVFDRRIAATAPGALPPIEERMGSTSGTWIERRSAGLYELRLLELWTVGLGEWLAEPGGADRDVVFDAHFAGDLVGAGLDGSARLRASNLGDLEFDAEILLQPSSRCGLPSWCRRPPTAATRRWHWECDHSCWEG